MSNINQELKFRKQFKGNTQHKVEVFLGETSTEKQVLPVNELRIGDKTIEEHLLDLYKKYGELLSQYDIVLAENKELHTTIKNLLGLKAGL